jgi:hypothetical protein
MLHLGKMQAQTALFFETVEEIYARIFRTLKPRTALPRISVRFRKYANANSRVRLADGNLSVDISDLLEDAPAPIQEALALILLSKLFRRVPDRSAVACYRHYLYRPDIRQMLHSAKQTRGRKSIQPPQGDVYDLDRFFADLNAQYFDNSMPRPQLGWSRKGSRTTLGHYDPSHHSIVLTKLLDSKAVSESAVKYVLFHEMLHLRYPAEYRGSRRCVHTREFKEAEKRFEHFAKAKCELQRFIELL